MLAIQDIIHTLSGVYDKYDNIKLGIAGSYANNTVRKSSDLDVVIDGDSMRLEIMDYIKSLFDIKVDVLWVDLLKKEDEELDSFALSIGLPVNEHSVYKTIMHEVKWL